MAAIGHDAQPDKPSDQGSVTKGLQEPVDRIEHRHAARHADPPPRCAPGDPASARLRRRIRRAPRPGGRGSRRVTRPPRRREFPEPANPERRTRLRGAPPGPSVPRRIPAVRPPGSRRAAPRPASMSVTGRPRAYWLRGRLRRGASLGRCSSWRRGLRIRRRGLRPGCRRERDSRSRGGFCSRHSWCFSLLVRRACQWPAGSGLGRYAIGESAHRSRLPIPPLPAQQFSARFRATSRPGSPLDSPRT